MSARMNALDTLYSVAKKGREAAGDAVGAPVRLAKAAGATMGGRSVARLKSRKP